MTAKRAVHKCTARFGFRKDESLFPDNGIRKRIQLREEIIMGQVLLCGVEGLTQDHGSKGVAFQREIAQNGLFIDGRCAVRTGISAGIGKLYAGPVGKRGLLNAARLKFIVERRVAFCSGMSQSETIAVSSGIEDEAHRALFVLRRII